MKALSPVIDVVTARRDIAALASEWDDLVEHSVAPTFFQSWEWIRAWRETLGADRELVLVAARHPADGLLVGIAPFAIEPRRRRGLPHHRALVFMGAGPAAPDHLDLIIRRGHLPEVAPALWGAVVRHGGWDIVDLDGVRSASIVASHLLRRRRDGERHTTSTACPYLPLPGTWQAYESTLSGNIRTNLGRYARKLARDSAATVITRSITDPAESVDVIRRLADLHQRVRTARGDAGAFSRPGMLEFHTTLAPRLAATGRLRLYALQVGSATVAAIYCMRFGDVVSFYQTGYDPAYARYGPGRHVMAHAIRGAIEEGAREFDFLRGDEAYKSEWGAAERNDVRITVPVTARGRVALGRRRARRMISGNS